MDLSEENETLKTVWEDLDYLTKLLDKKDYSDASLRRLSSGLRFLFIDKGGMLFKVSKQFGIKLKIVGDEKSILSSNIVVDQRSGGKYNGLMIKHFSILNKALNDEEIKNRYKQKKKKIKPIKLTKFLKENSIVIEGVSINREVVIKYIANKLGGNHLDFKRNDLKELECKYKLLDKHRSLKLAGKDSVYFDLLSIGQRVLYSKDLQKFKRKIRLLLKERNLIEKWI